MKTNSSSSKTMSAAAMLFAASMFSASLFSNFGRYYNHPTGQFDYRLILKARRNNNRNKAQKRR